MVLVRVGQKAADGRAVVAGQAVGAVEEMAARAACLPVVLRKAVDLQAASFSMISLPALPHCPSRAPISE